MPATRAIRHLRKQLDVDRVTAPTDGQSPVWRDDSGQFEWESGVGGGLSGTDTTTGISHTGGTAFLTLATQSVPGAMSAADKKKVDGVPLLVVHADGTSTTYDTPALAVAGAVSGDTIMVSPGSYTVSTNLAKNGVDWWFAPGATVTWSAAGVGYIFDDNAAARSYTVGGHGNFVRTISGVPADQLGDVDTGAGSACGVFRAVKSSSVVRFQWNTITLNVNEVTTALGWYTGLYCDGGSTVTLDGNEINGDRLSSAVYSYCNAFWWGNGIVRGRVGRIYSPSTYSSATFLFAAIYAVNLLAGAAGDFYLNGEEIDCPYPVNCQSDNVVNALWMHYRRVSGNGTTAGGKHYLTVQKLAGAWSVQAGKFYLTAQKAGGGLASVIGTAPVIQVSGGYFTGDIGDFEGGTGVLEWLRVDDAASECHLSFRNMPAGSGQNAVFVSAGTANLYSGKIVTDAGKFDLRRTGGTLNVAAGVSYSTAKTSGTITKLNNSDQVNEGSTNLFYTDARARASISGTSNRVTVSAGGVIDIAAAYDTSLASTYAAKAGATFSGTVSHGGNAVTNVADPTQAQDAATKTYVDAIAQGLPYKSEVRVASTASVTISNPATAVFDGVTLSSGDRVLLKDQSTASQNGIYLFNGSSSAMTRTTDADASSEVKPGLFVFVSEGAVNGNNGYALTSDDPITLGSTSLTFTQFSGLGQVTAGAGLTKTANQLDVIGTANRITVNADSIDISSAYDTALAATYVPQSRTVSATGPLSGGGALSGNITLTTSMATNKLIGRGTSGTGVMEEITLGSNLSLSGTTLNASGGGAAPSGSNGDIQYYSGGALVGTDDLRWDTSTTTMTVAGKLNVSDDVTPGKSVIFTLIAQPGSPAGGNSYWDGSDLWVYDTNQAAWKRLTPSGLTRIESACSFGGL